MRLASIIKLASIVACVFLGGWSAYDAGVGLAARGNPQAALRIDPDHAPALLRSGELMLAQSPDKAADRRVSMARTARRDEPLAAAAPRQIAMAEDRNLIGTDAFPLMDLAARLSRRDGVAQIWLAQHAIKQGELGRSVEHLDTLLRVHEKQKNLIFPQLAKIDDSAPFAKALAVRSDRGALWVSEYLMFLLSGAGKAEFVADVLSAIREPQSLRHGDDITRETIRTLAVAEKGARAADLFAAVRKSGLIQTEAGSENSSPTDLRWTLLNWPDAASEWRGEGSSKALDVLVESGTRRTIAQQVRFDPPGNFRYSPEQDNLNIADGAKITIRLDCAGKAAREVWSLTPDGPVGGQRTYRIDEDCQTQLYSIDVIGPDSGSPLTASLQRLAPIKVASAR